MLRIKMWKTLSDGEWGKLFPPADYGVSQSIINLPSRVWDEPRPARHFGEISAATGFLLEAFFKTILEYIKC